MSEMFSFSSGFSPRSYNDDDDDDDEDGSLKG